METKLPLFGLWANTSKDGKTYFSGTFGDSRIVIFPNGYKESDKHPDYKAYLVEKKKKEQTEEKPKAWGDSPNTQKTIADTLHEGSLGDEPLPF